VRLIDYITQSQQNCESFTTRNFADAISRRMRGVWGDPQAVNQAILLIAFAGFFREVFLELTFFTLMLVSISRRFFLAGDIGPFG